MGFLDTMKTAAKDMGHAVADGVKGAEKAAVDEFHGVVAGVKTTANTVVQAGATVAHGVEQATHDAAAATRHHDVIGGIARVHQDLAAGAGTALGQAWDGAGKAAGQVAQGVHKAAVDAGTGIGQAYDKASGAATHVATAVAGKQVGAAVGSATHGVGAAGRALADGSLAAVAALGGDVGSMVHGTGALAIGVARVGTDSAYRHQALEKFKGTALSIGDMELAAIRDPAGAKNKIVGAVRGKVEQFNQEGLKAAREGKLPEFGGDKLGHITAFAATFVAPEAKVGEVAGAAERLGEVAEAARGTEAAEKVGAGAEAAGGAGRAAAGEAKGEAAGIEAATPKPGGGVPGEPPKPPAKIAGSAPEPGDEPGGTGKAGEAGRPESAATPELEAARARFMNKMVYVGEGVTQKDVDAAVDAFSRSAKDKANILNVMSDKLSDRMVIVKPSAEYLRVTGNTDPFQTEMVGSHEVPAGVTPYAQSHLATPAPGLSEAEGAGQALPTAAAADVADKVGAARELLRSKAFIGPGVTPQDVEHAIDQALTKRSPEDMTTLVGKNATSFLVTKPLGGGVMETFSSFAKDREGLVRLRPPDAPEVLPSNDTSQIRAAFAAKYAGTTVDAARDMLRGKALVSAGMTTQDLDQAIGAIMTRYSPPEVAGFLHREGAAFVINRMPYTGRASGYFTTDAALKERFVPLAPGDEAGAQATVPGPQPTREPPAAMAAPRQPRGRKVSPEVGGLPENSKLSPRVMDQLRRHATENFMNNVALGKGVTIDEAGEQIEALSKGMAEPEKLDYYISHRADTFVVEKAADGSVSSHFQSKDAYWARSDRADYDNLPDKLYGPEPEWTPMLQADDDLGLGY